MSVPTLLSMCCQAVDRMRIINLDNALDVMAYGRRFVPKLAESAEAFVQISWAGLAARHSPEVLEAALGRDDFVALNREVDELTELVRRMRRHLGRVVDTEVVASTRGATAEASAAPAPNAPVPSALALSPSTPSGDADTRPRATRFSFGGSLEKCDQCAKSVYAAERISPKSGRVWHAPCFRCDECGCKLTIDAFELGPGRGTRVGAASDTVPLCRSHYAQRRSAAGGIAATPVSPRGPAVQGAAGSVVPLSSAAAAAHGATLRMIHEHRSAWGDSQCVRCAGAVYAMERRLARSHHGDCLVHHTRCFRCADCNTPLRPDLWELLGEPGELEAGAGTLLCRVHFAARVAESARLASG